MRKRFLALAGLLLVFAQSAFAAEPITVGSVGSSSADLWTLQIALAKNFFTQHGLNVNMVTAQSNAAVIQQLVAGSLNFSVGSGLVDPMRAVNQGAALAIIRIEIPYPPYSLLAKSNIRTIKDLAGKTISVGGAKDITRIYLERMLDPNGVTPGHYDLTYAGATSARFAALRSGAVDAALLAPPFSFMAQAGGFTDLGEVKAYADDLPFTGTVTQRNWAKSHMKEVREFVAAETQAIDWFYDPKNKDEAIKIMVQRFHAKPADMQESYAYFMKNKMFEKSTSVSIASLKSIVAALVKTGDLPKNFNAGSLLLTQTGK